MTLSRKIRAAHKRDVEKLALAACGEVIEWRCLHRGKGAFQVVRSDSATGGFAVFHLNGDRIVCFEAVNAPAEFMSGGLLIGKGTPVDASLLAETAVSMKAELKVECRRLLQRSAVADFAPSDRNGSCAAQKFTWAVFQRA